MENFFSGNVLYADDFNSEQIKLWHEQEKEAYANLENNQDRKSGLHTKKLSES
jgi:hypothetical protein